LGGYALFTLGFKYVFWLLIIRANFPAPSRSHAVSGYLPVFFAWNVWGFLRPRLSCWWRSTSRLRCGAAFFFKKIH